MASIICGRHGCNNPVDIERFPSGNCWLHQGADPSQSGVSAKSGSIGSVPPSSSTPSAVMMSRQDIRNEAYDIKNESMKSDSSPAYRQIQDHLGMEPVLEGQREDIVRRPDGKYSFHNTGQNQLYDDPIDEYVDENYDQIAEDAADAMLAEGHDSPDELLDSIKNKRDRHRDYLNYSQMLHPELKEQREAQMADHHSSIEGLMGEIGDELDVATPSKAHMTAIKSGHIRAGEDGGEWMVTAEKTVYTRASGGRASAAMRVSRYDDDTWDVQSLRDNDDWRSFPPGTSHRDVASWVRSRFA